MVMVQWMLGQNFKNKTNVEGFMLDIYELNIEIFPK